MNLLIPTQERKISVKYTLYPKPPTSPLCKDFLLFTLVERNCTKRLKVCNCNVEFAKWGVKGGFSVVGSFSRMPMFANVESVAVVSFIPIWKLFTPLEFSEYLCTFANEPKKPCVCDPIGRRHFFFAGENSDEPQSFLIGVIFALLRKTIQEQARSYA